MKMLLSFLLAGAFLWVIILVIVISLSITVGCLMSPELGQFTYVDHKALQAPKAIREIPIWIDKSFTPFDQDAIANAVNTWNYALNGYIHLSIVDSQFDMEVSKIVAQVRGGGWLFLRIKSDSPIIPIVKEGYRVLGFTEMVGGQHLWLVMDRLANEDIFGITLHEIGHLLGANHTNGQHLMFPYYTRARYQCIDKESLSEVAAYYGLSLNSLNYCLDGLDAVEKTSPEGKPVDHAKEPGCGNQK